MHPNGRTTHQDVGVSAGRAILRAVRRRRSRAERRAQLAAPPVFWGRIGSYEAVTRSGILLLLAPDPSHPALRAKRGP